MADTQENQKPNHPLASKQSNNRAILSKQEWLEAVNAIDDVFLVISPEFIVLEINNYGLELFNKQREEVIGKKCYKVFDDCKESSEDCPLLKSLESKNSEVGEKYFPDKQKWFSVKSTPVKDERGTIVKFVDLMRDITDQKSMEEELRDQYQETEQKEQKFRTLYENAPLAYQSLDEEGYLIDVNPAWLQALGYDKEEVIGQKYASFLDPDWKQHFEKNFPAFKKRGYVHDVQFRLRHKKGHYIDVSFEGCIGYHPDGSFKQTFCVFKDITDQKLSEKALKESELKYRFLFDRAEMLISVFEKQGTCQMVNQKVADLFDWEPADFIGKSFTDFYPVEGKDYNQRIQEVFESGLIQHYEDKVSLRGKERWLYSSLQPIKNEEGITTLVQVISYDITKQKTAELELKKREVRQRTMISNISDVIAIMDKNGIITYKSPNIQKWFGWEPDELIGKSAWEKVHKDDIPWLRKAFITLLKKKDASEKFIYRYKSKDRGYRIVSLTARNLLHNPDIEGVLLNYHDITEKKEAEKKLKQSEEMFSKAFKKAPILMSISDIDTGRYMDVNQAFLEGTGYKREEVIGKTSIEIGFLREKDRKELLIKELNEKGYASNLELQLKKANRETIICKYDGEIIKIDGKNRLLSIAVDITQRKKTEQQLKQSEQRFQNMLLTIPDMVSIHDKDMNILYSNWKEFGNVPEEKRVIGSKCYKTYRNYEVVCPDCQAKKVLDTLQPFSSDIKLPDGRWVDLRVMPLLNGDGTADTFVEWVRDISESKNAQINLEKKNEELQAAEEELKASNDELRNINLILDGQKRELLKAKQKAEESEERYLNYIKQSSEGIYRLEMDKAMDTSLGLDEQVDYIYDNAYIVECNETFVKMYGVDSIDEFIGARVIDIHGGRDHPVNRKEMMNFVSEGYRTVNKLTEEHDKEGNLHYISNNMVGVVENNQLIRMWGTQIDVTEQVQMQERLVKAKEKAEESDRLKSAFLANMSHEIRTPMNGIMGFTELLRKPELSGEKKKKYIDTIQTSGQRMLNTINDLIDISRIEAGQVEVSDSEVNINEQLNFLYTFFQPEANEKDLKLTCSMGLPLREASIQIDEEKFQSILTNLIKNAIKYTHKGSIDFGYHLKDGQLKFYVKDTGIGIDPKHHNTVFERFTQEEMGTTRSFEGAGLGLPITKAYVEKLGGRIWLESKKNSGSVFYFTLPFKPTKTKKAQTSNVIVDADSKNFGNLHFLLVEDDLVCQEFMSEILEPTSVKLSIAGSWEEAKENYDVFADFDLILMDIRLPGISGFDAIREIKKHNKQLPVIAQTAFAMQDDSKKCLQAGADDYIAKPINKDQLLTILRKILSK